MSKRTVETVKGVVVAVLLLCMWIACCYVECHYTRKDCTVVHTEGQLVEVEDKQGHVWCYEVEGDAPSVGTVVDVHMYTAHTDSYIYDDEVVGVTVVVQ
jgi:hypothetical protein